MKKALLTIIVGFAFATPVMAANNTPTVKVKLNNTTVSILSNNTTLSNIATLSNNVSVAGTSSIGATTAVGFSSIGNTTISGTGNANTGSFVIIPAVSHGR